MSRRQSVTRRHILSVAESFLALHENSELRVADIAGLAEVGVPTVYYYFASRIQLVAEAQAVIYMKIVEPLHAFLDAAERALEAESEALFICAIGDNIEAAWSYSRGIDGWKIVRLVMDIWEDAETRQTFCAQLDVQSKRWVDAIEAAKSLGWIDEGVDTGSLIAAGWAGSLGQVIFSESKVLNFTPQGIRTFCLGIDKARVS